MLHHVSLEVDPAKVDECIEFWSALGFEQVDPPGPLGGAVTWLERAATQVHLIHTEDGSVPVLGHAAVVAADFDRALEALESGGHTVEAAQELWGERRAFAISPSGHRVELMEAPPGAALTRHAPARPGAARR